MPQSKARWYPSRDQLKDPAATERAFRQLLNQHYDLVDQVDAMRQAPPQGTSGATSTSGNGPSDTKLLGLYVQPVDVTQLANGATLKFDKKNESFKFS